MRENLPILDPELVCSALIPPTAWLHVFAAMARSIETADRLAPDRWGLRLAANSIMLKVGSHEVLQVGPWELPLHLIVDRESVPRALRARTDLSFSHGPNCFGESATGYYSSNPGTEACDLPFEAIEHVYPLLQDAHEKVIKRAAARFNPATRRGHSAALVTFVARQTGRSLPQPSYVVLPTPTPSPTTKLNWGSGFGSSENNALVETAAVKAVTKRYQTAGWTVQSVEAACCGYDLSCTRGPEVRHIEVKGTSGPEQRFIITANELHVATSDVAFVLALVTSALTQEPEILEWPFSELHAAFTFNPISYFAIRLPVAGVA